MNELEKAVVDAALNVHAGLAGVFPPGAGSAQRDLWEACNALLTERKPRFTAVEYVWVRRTWRDVRQNYTIAPVAADGLRLEQHAAWVIKIGPVNHWHAAPDANPYRPNESPMEWSSIPVTLRATDGQDFTPANGMNPDAAVDIKITKRELAVIETLGGWENRIEIIEERE